VTRSLILGLLVVTVAVLVATAWWSTQRGALPVPPTSVVPEAPPLVEEANVHAPAVINDEPAHGQAQTVDTVEQAQPPQRQVQPPQRLSAPTTGRNGVQSPPRPPNAAAGRKLTDRGF
jgi:hypothetical protein